MDPTHNTEITLPPAPALSDTAAIAETAATAAVAQVEAEAAQEDAEEALSEVERLEEQWAFTEQMYSAQAERITELESRLAEMHAPPEPETPVTLAGEAEVGAEVTPPTLNMEVSQPAEAPKRAGMKLSRKPKPIKFW